MVSKKKILLVLLLGLFFMSIAACVSIHKSEQTSSPKVAYGVNVDMTAMIPDTPYTITTASGGNFFDLATQLDINTLRITDVQWEMTGEEYSQAIWHSVFDEAEHHHINIILLLIGGGGHTAIEQAHTLLDHYGLAQSSALWLIDLNNEPDVSDPQSMAELRKEAAYVHQVAPRVPITIGGWKSQLPGHPGEFDWQDPADIPRFIDLVDVVSAHLYEFDKAAQNGFPPQQWTQRFLSVVRQQARHKPILLEEFGAGNGLAPSSDPTATSSPQWQLYVYQGVLREVSVEYDQGIIGAIAWIIAPRPAFPNDYQGDMTGSAFVLDHGRRLLPAASAFSAAAHAEQQKTGHQASELQGRTMGG